jgi:hypothetical protein
MGFYNGIQIKCGKEQYVLVGPPVTLIAAEMPVRPEVSSVEPVQLSLF